MEFLNKFRKAYEKVEPGINNVLTSLGSQYGAMQLQKGLIETHKATDGPETPAEELNRITQSFKRAISRPGNSLTPEKVHIDISPIHDGVFLADDDVSLVKSPRKANTLAHELGHAVNWGTPQGQARMRIYGSGNPGQHRLNNVTRMAGMATNIDPNAGVVDHLISGAASKLLDPQALTIFKEEATAWQRGRNLLRRSGIPITPKMNVNALSAFSTYPVGIASGGLALGARSYLVSQAADKSAKAIRDLTDPLLYRGELSPEEQALVKYGYDRNKHRVVSGGDMSGETFTIQPRFFQKGK